MLIDSTSFIRIRRLLLLPKKKSDSGSGPVFHKFFNPDPKEKRKILAGVEHVTLVIGPVWTLDINWQDSSKRREWVLQRFRGKKVM